MKNILLTIALLGAFVPVHAENTDLTIEELGQRMTFFYSKPSKAEFDAIQVGISINLKELSTGTEETAKLMAVFLGKVQMKHGWSIMDLGMLDDGARSIAARDKSEFSRFVWNDAQISPTRLDIWWTSFFATGDTGYLDKIIDQVGDLDAQSGAANILVMGAANWSFESNCRQHQAVLDYAKNVLATQAKRPNRKTIENIVYSGIKGS
ncbi:hypothetical protein [Methylophaga sp. OBS4]|uniref:hypothetical protein n=1 Tax=Methylophaga sp. OBS4 TaxID=2991935 RepID=UPI002252ACE6|nr:hypothetical protein [Methylophaga sp. OBS4]MCX4187826.1 hypothetical protein [Methylophaga sp. OBS4]